MRHWGQSVLFNCSLSRTLHSAKKRPVMQPIKSKMTFTSSTWNFLLKNLCLPLTTISPVSFSWREKVCLISAPPQSNLRTNGFSRSDIRRRITAREKSYEWHASKTTSSNWHTWLKGNNIKIQSPFHLVIQLSESNWGSVWLKLNMDKCEWSTIFNVFKK